MKQKLFLLSVLISCVSLGPICKATMPQPQEDPTSQEGQKTSGIAAIVIPSVERRELSVFSSSHVGMRFDFEGNNEPEKKTMTFRSGEVASRLGQRFQDFAQKKKFDQLFNLCTTIYEFPAGSAIGDVEDFWYNSIAAQSIAYLTLADNPDCSESQQHYEKIIFLISDYERFFKDRTCNPVTRDNINNHLILLYPVIVKVYGHLTEVYETTSIESAYESAEKGTSYGEEYIRYVKGIAEKSRKGESLSAFGQGILESNVSLIPSVQMDLMALYFAAYQYNYNNRWPLLCTEYFDKMNLMHKELKNNSEFRDKSRSIMNALDVFIASKKVSPGGSKLEKYRNRNAAKKRAELLDIIKSQPCEGQSIKRTISDKLQESFAQINLEFSECALNRGGRFF